MKRSFVQFYCRSFKPEVVRIKEGDIVGRTIQNLNVEATQGLKSERAPHPLQPRKKLGIIAQTTQSFSLFNEVSKVDNLVTYRIKDGKELPALGSYMAHNGFSSVWDLANPSWVEIDPLGKIKSSLSVEGDEIYCSVFTEYEFTTVCGWANENSKIKFILGGPAIWPKRRDLEIKYLIPLPENVEVRSGLAEDIFNVKWTPDRWHIELPGGITEPFLYSYYVYDECYWGKCTFCKIRAKSWCGSKTSAIDPEWKREYNTFSELEKAPPGMVWLSADSMPPHIIELLPDLPQDKSYMFFMRAGEEEARLVERFVSKIPSSNEIMFRPNIGVEFPSARMLKRIRKGVTIDNLLKVLNALSSHPSISVVCGHIVGWPDLVEEDIEEAKKFYDRLENPGAIKFTVNWLSHYEENSGRPIESKYRKIGYYSRLEDSKMIELNKRYLKLLMTQSRLFISDVINQELGLKG